MITAKEALDKYRKKHPAYEEVFIVADIGDRYVLAPGDFDGIDYDTISKKDGTEGRILLWDYAEFVDSGLAKKVDI